jgi:putative transposase
MNIERKFRPKDGIHFQGLRYMDPTLAEYAGEDVTIRYDPRDIAEIRVFYADRFLCRAVCQELAGQTVSLKEIQRARDRRRRELRSTIKDRSELVRTYLKVHQVEPEPPPPLETKEEKPSLGKGTRRLKRYENE